jgi:3-isopropylmalate/(R)-2-methylmalate dehydratase large subunit
MKTTLFEKIWKQHLVTQETHETPAILYIDAHLIHEVTSPQAFSMLKERALSVRQPKKTFATCDHSTPTTPANKDGKFIFNGPKEALQVKQLENNCEEFGISLFKLGDKRQGIIHVIAPEQGITQPGMTIVCGDSHTSTHGAFGALAFGIGTSEVGYVLATQALPQHRPKTFGIEINGTLTQGTTAKDLILHIIQQIGIGGATGHVIEYLGSTIREMSMEERMTICNMSIEAGARAGMIAPDETTFTYLYNKPYAPKAIEWEKSLKKWRLLKTDDGAVFDQNLSINAKNVSPMITYGTNPQMGIKIEKRIPVKKEKKALDYMGFKEKEFLIGKKVDVVFIGSCTNSRISDLREAASMMQSKKIAHHVRCLIVPGSHQIKQQAEKEGLSNIFIQAGAEWREPGCSMCLGMNGDTIKANELCVSTSNRNFEGRQGKGGRTLLASPLTAAASAIAGKIVDPREAFFIQNMSHKE